MIDAFFRAGGLVLQAVPGLERPVFSCLRVSDVRMFRSFRFRLFKAWGACQSDRSSTRCVTLSSGVRMLVDVRDLHGITYIEPNVFEPATTAHLLKHLREGDVFLDVGANIGWYSLQAAARVGSAGTVWSFEPNPSVARLLHESVAQNHFDAPIHVIEAALAESDDAAREFYISIDSGNSGLSTLLPDTNVPIDVRHDPSWVMQVRAITFDQFAADHRIEKLDVVKIDVEGAEHLVLEGMKRTLTQFRPRLIICETEVDSLAARTLVGHGYERQMIEKKSDNHDWGNVLFTLNS